MHPSLKHSIYLKEAPMEEESANPFNKTEEIMKEPEGHMGINETARKKSYNYHTFEKTFMSAFQTRETAFQRSPQRDEESNLVKELQLQINQEKKQPVKRFCHETFQHILEQYRECIPQKVDQKDREKRDKLAEQAKYRKQEKMEKFKQNVTKRVKFEAKEDEESSIQAQIYVDPEVKSKKIDQFLKRQQYMEQQRSILREMREFCTYGAIKVKNTV